MSGVSRGDHASAETRNVSDLDPDQLDVTLLAHETAMQLGEDSVSSQLVADVFRLTKKPYVVLGPASRRAILVAIEVLITERDAWREQVERANERARVAQDHIEETFS